MSKEYHKIVTLWKREDKKPHNMMVGTYALPEFEALENVEWVSTEKIDGTNIRIMWDGNQVIFGGKTDNAQIPTPLIYKLQELFMGQANEQKLEEVFGPEPATLYGEGFGNRIQGVGKQYNPDGVDFILFDVRIGDFWLERENVEDIAQKLDLKVVPIVFKGPLKDTSDFVASGFDSQHGELKAEGVVSKPAVEMFNRKGERIITKLKFKDFQKLEQPK